MKHIVQLSAEFETLVGAERKIGLKQNKIFALPL